MKSFHRYTFVFLLLVMAESAHAGVCRWTIRNIGAAAFSLIPYSSMPGFGRMAANSKRFYAEKPHRIVYYEIGYRSYVILMDGKVYSLAAYRDASCPNGCSQRQVVTEIKTDSDFRSLTRHSKLVHRLTKDMQETELAHFRSAIQTALLAPNRVTEQYEGSLQEAWGQEGKVSLPMGGRNNRFKNKWRMLVAAGLLTSPWPIPMQSSYMAGLKSEAALRWPVLNHIPWEGSAVGPLVKFFTWPMDRVIDFFYAQADAFLADDYILQSVVPFAFTQEFAADYHLKDHKDLNWGVNPYIELHIDRTDAWELDLTTLGMFVTGPDGFDRQRDTDGPQWGDPQGYWKPWKLIPAKASWEEFSLRLRDPEFTDKIFAQIAEWKPTKHPHLKWKTAPDTYSGGMKETDLIDYDAYFLPNSVVSLVNPSRTDLATDHRAQLPAEFVLTLLNTVELWQSPKRLEYYDKLMASDEWRAIFRGAYGMPWEDFRKFLVNRQEQPTISGPSTSDN